MKEGIHPAYHMVTVVCACGETFQTRSTRQEMRLEICSKCHPFFTGKQKLIDSAGRVERFQRRYKDAGKEAPKGGPKAASTAGKPPAASGKTSRAAKSTAAGKGGTNPAPAGEGAGA
jgi:large subunit ribosomal protein L31